MKPRHALFVAVSALFLTAPAMDAMAAGNLVAVRARPMVPRAIAIVPARRPVFTAAPRIVPARQFTHGPVRIDPRRFGNGRVIVSTGAACVTGDGGVALTADPATCDTASSATTDSGTGTAACVSTGNPRVIANVARADMEQVRSRVQANLDASPDWVHVNSDLTQAIDDVEATRTRVEQSLGTRLDYQSALAEKKAAHDEADALHAQGDPTPAEMTPVAERGLEAASTVTQIETAALAADQPFLAARARLRDLAEAREVMAKQVSADVQNDPVWQAAKRELNALG